MEFGEVTKREEIAWRQRSWLKNGDKNTKFFHRMANVHKRFNSVDTLKVGDLNITDPEAIKRAVKCFCQSLYNETEEWRRDFTIQDTPVFSLEDQTRLQRNLDEEEILESIKSCAIDKAPGLMVFQ